LPNAANDFRTIEARQADIDNVARYTLDNFGPAQAEEYLSGLYNIFDLLAGNPMFGREWTRGRRRCVYRSHHVYYRLAGGRVFITQIRHASQKPI